jgi:predicted DNA-binding antitoxin AbrB/MazE fold protein
MASTIEAVYEGGVFRPTREIALTEGTLVEVLIPATAVSHDPKAVAARLSQIAAKASRGGRTESTSRDHDRYLYGENPSP